MIVLHFDLQPQFKYMNYFIYTSHQIYFSCSDSVSDEVIGTHFIDLSRISNDGANGMQCYIYNF